MYCFVPFFRITYSGDVVMCRNCPHSCLWWPNPSWGSWGCTILFPTSFCIKLLWLSMACKTRCPWRSSKVRNDLSSRTCFSPIHLLPCVVVAMEPVLSIPQFYPVQCLCSSLARSYSSLLSLPFHFFCPCWLKLLLSP